MKKSITTRMHCFLLLPAFSLLLFTACDDMLTAKFESDSTGNLPDKSLPGNPSGDEMTYASVIETQLEVVATPTASAQKSVEYSSVPPSGPISGHSSWVGFKAKSTNFAKPITFTWTAQKSFNSGGADLYIDCSDGSGVVAARIKVLANGDVKLVNNIATDAGNIIGNIPNGERHTFLVTVDLPDEEYNISVIKSSGNLVQNGNGLLTENVALYHNPARPTVSFKFDPFVSGQEYVIDEVFIRRKN